MAWITPKIDWKPADGVTSDDVNRIEGNILDLNSRLPDFGIGLMHNTVYRGKDLGTINSSNIESFLTEHKVASGEFTDLYLGDTFVIADGVYDKRWIIAGFDIGTDKGSSFTGKHHLACIPTSRLLNAVMNNPASTTGGYVASSMHTTTIPAVDSALTIALGSHLLKRRARLSSDVDAAGASSGASNVDVYSELMSEVQVFGSTIYSSSGYDVGEADEKLPIFNFTNIWNTGLGGDIWLRGISIVNPSQKAFVSVQYSTGFVANASSASSKGVLPLIYIG